MKKQLKIKVFGDVQGVFFRQSAREKARELSITGWAKNAEDGAVEIMAEGEEDKLVKFIDWCNYGPPSAKVEKVEVEWQEAKKEFSAFEVR